MARKAKRTKTKAKAKKVAKRAKKKAKKAPIRKSAKRNSATRKPTSQKSIRKVRKIIKVPPPTFEQLVPGGEPEFVTPMDQV